MKKFKKWSAVIAAGMMLFALVACDDGGSSSSSDDNAPGGAGSAASDGLQPVTEIDVAKFSAGTYRYMDESKYQEGMTITEEGTVMIAGTNDDSIVTVTKEPWIKKFSSKEAYEKEIKVYKDECGDDWEEDYFDEQTFTITEKLSDDKKVYTISFKKFKEKFLAFPEDEEDEKYTEKSLAGNKNKIVRSYKKTYTNTFDGTVHISKSIFTLELVRS